MSHPTTSASTVTESTPHGHPSLADVTERLLAEFESRLDLAMISRTVLACRHDLHGEPVDTLAELIERRARQRLLQAVEADANPGVNPKAESRPSAGD
ncbi:three-helix bundle dimerization domain-containing protein [Pseudonocardia hispaniensis]|uniref:Three-helix bundle dimerization domain-containing protein n=1 Tax=Pseudonocardia hispaniensis TaxID=904933 RepID=A0ABW1J623_9PSEU